MPQNWQRSLISQHEAELQGYLAEIRAADDLDLWAEASAKLCDVLLVYRRAMKQRTVKFSDDRIYILMDDMLNEAVITAFSEAPLDMELD